MKLRMMDNSEFDLSRGRLMGILNVTPDSFSDGGQWLDPAAGVERGLRLAAEGADILDIGGESTRPGAQPVPAAEQIRRVVPVIRELHTRLEKQPARVWLSIDTRLPEVAEAAVAAGAGMVNDISAGCEALGGSERMLELAAHHGLPVVLMHMQGTPGTMQQDPRYDNVVAAVVEHLRLRAQAAERAGVRRDRIILDPGIGFGKTTAHNLELLRELRQLVELGFAVLLGASRKRFLGQVTGGEGRTVLKPAELGSATCATTLWGWQQGVRLFRVHDVEMNRQTLRTIEAITRKNDS